MNSDVHTPVVVVGGSGFGREAIDLLQTIDRPCLGVIDDSPSTESLDKLRELEVDYLGPIDSWLATIKSSTCYIVAIAWPSVRSRIAKNMRAHGHEPATLIHPSAQIGRATEISPGTIVCSGALISTFVTLGPHTHINPGATVGHDALVGDYTTLNPQATVSGNCTIGRESLIGANSILLQGIRVGMNATIGAGSVVTKDIPAGMTAKGVPAKWQIAPTDGTS